MERNTPIPAAACPVPEAQAVTAGDGTLVATSRASSRPPGAIRSTDAPPRLPDSASSASDRACLRQIGQSLARRKYATVVPLPRTARRLVRSPSGETSGRSGMTAPMSGTVTVLGMMILQVVVLI